MKFLRTFILLLLCAMLPVSGLAASGLAGQCPMQTTAPATADTVATGMPGCESMKPASGQDGKSKGFLCKATAQCQMGSLYHPVSVPTVVRPAGSFSPVSFHFAESLSIREPDGPWRPPRFL